MSTHSKYTLNRVLSGILGSILVVHAAWLFALGFKAAPMVFTFILMVELLLAAPFFGFLFGIAGCRTSARTISGFLLILAIFTPLAQHEIDRTFLFWLCWSAFTIAVISNLFALRPQPVNS